MDSGSRADPSGGGIQLSGSGMLQLVLEGGASVSVDNIAAAINGAKSFVNDADSSLSLNNGAYGDAKCWVGQTTGHGGILFTRMFKISSFAFGRDNTGLRTDHFAGSFTLQYTEMPVPATITMDETRDPRAGWVTLATLDYLRAGGSLFNNPWRRHIFTFTPVQATAVRLLVFDGGMGCTV